MATIVNNPGGSERVIDRTGDSSAGWAVAVIILLAVVLIGGYFWTRGAAPATQPAERDAANINVTVPAPSGGDTTGTGGGAAGSGAGAGGSTQTGGASGGASGTGGTQTTP